MLNGDGGLELSVIWSGFPCFFFFFLTKMAIEMFCGSWFLFGVLGIEIRLISL